MSKLIEKFRPAQWQILIMLGRYKFLTARQMVELGIRKQTQNVHAELRPLKDRKYPFVEEQTYGAEDGRGRLASVFSLSKYGAYLLHESGIDPLEVRFPKRLGECVRWDYNHRLRTVDTQIQLDRLLGESENVDRFQHITYFDYQGSNRAKGKQKSRLTAKGRLVVHPDEQRSKERVVIPDLITVLWHSDERKTLVFTEVAYTLNYQHITKGMHGHRLLIEQGDVCSQLGLPGKPVTPWVLFLLEDEKGAPGVIKRFLENPKLMKVSDDILVSTWKHFQKEPDAWFTVTKKKVNPFKPTELATQATTTS